MTTREAARILGTGREGAARVLASGLAGPALRCGRATLYPADTVRDLAARPAVDATALHHTFPDGLLVGRIDPRRGDPHGPWVVSPLRMVGLGWMAGRQGRTPLICTVQGFVLGAYEVTGHTWLPVRAPRERRVILDLADAGPWGASVLGRRLVTPPGHAVWTWRSDVLPYVTGREDTARDGQIGRALI